MTEAALGRRTGSSTRARATTSGPVGIRMGAPRTEAALKTRVASKSVVEVIIVEQTVIE
jgi:hypothetical protein